MPTPILDPPAISCGPTWTPPSPGRRAAPRRPRQARAAEAAGAQRRVGGAAAAPAGPAAGAQAATAAQGAANAQAAARALLPAPHAAAPAATAACTVNYSVNQWNTGFTAAITITNNGPAITSWTLAYSYTRNQTLSPRCTRTRTHT